MRRFNSVTRQRGYGIGGIFKGFHRTYAPAIKEEPDEEIKELENEEVSKDPDQQLYHQKVWKEFWRNIEVPDDWEECEWPDETDTYQEKRKRRRRRRKERICPYAQRLETRF